MTKKDKRELILNAAMKLLAEEGFHGAPMAQIAEEAGVGAGTIYRYFENRDVLIQEIHTKISDEFEARVMEGYPEGRPVRECFFYIGLALIGFYRSHPLCFRYNEQFYHSPYGLEVRRNKLLGESEDFDFCVELFETGREQQVIKDIPLAVFFVLGFAPVFWAVRDHHSGFIVLDDELAQTLVASCWDAVKM